MRNRTHLPTLAPGCTVTGRLPYIDRFKLRLDHTPFAIGRPEGEALIPHLNRTYFMQGRTRNHFKVRPRHLLFSGDVFFDDCGTGHPTLTLALEMNLTRFLSQNWELGQTPEILEDLSPTERLQWLTNANHPRPTQDLRYSLNGDDNFIPDSCLRTGEPPIHFEWLVPYVELALSFLAHEIGSALRLAANAGHSIEAATNPLIASENWNLAIPIRNWGLRQLEVYWEFWSQDAISEAANLTMLVERVATTSALTSYEPLTRNTDQAVLGISARAGNRYARTKIYAKLASRIRVEVAYDRNVRDIERRVSTTREDALDLHLYLPRITEVAALRADAMIQAAFAATVEDGDAITHNQVIGLFEALSREAGSPAIFAMLIRQLLTQGAITRLPSLPEQQRAVERLIARGYLVSVASGPGRTRTSFLPAPPYNRIIAALISLTRQTPATAI